MLKTDSNIKNESGLNGQAGSISTALSGYTLINSKSSLKPVKLSANNLSFPSFFLAFEGLGIDQTL